MSVYLEPILTAGALFPLLAFLITIPYLIYEYRKYGSVLLIKTILIYSFILYLLISYFLVILPLPPRSIVSHYTSPTMQLHLGRFLEDIFVTTHVVWNDPSTYISFFKASTVYTVLFNLFLTVPFGIFLRYYGKKKWYQVILYSFLLSLFFEWTQLSGLYGIYPRSYRLFDVDDLLINTLGGLLGFLVMPLFSKILPEREELELQSFEKGKKVTFFKRVFAYLIDFIFLLFSTIIFMILFPKLAMNNHFFEYYIVSAILIFILIPLLLDGRTIGKCILRIHLVSLNNKEIRGYQIIIRNFFLHFITLPIPYYLFCILKSNFPYWMMALFGVILIVNYIFFLFHLILVFFGKETLFGYERISKTKNESDFFEK